ncbi:MAG: hypothetical protein ACREDR_44675, partial [Blastocatellia bacterium]
NIKSKIDSKSPLLAIIYMPCSLLRWATHSKLPLDAVRQVENVSDQMLITTNARMVKLKQ